MPTLPKDRQIVADPDPHDRRICNFYLPEPLTFEGDSCQVGLLPEDTHNASFRHHQLLGPLYREPLLLPLRTIRLGTVKLDGDEQVTRLQLEFFQTPRSWQLVYITILRFVDTHHEWNGAGRLVEPGQEDS